MECVRNIQMGKVLFGCAGMRILMKNLILDYQLDKEGIDEIDFSVLLLSKA